MDRENFIDRLLAWTPAFVIAWVLAFAALNPSQAASPLVRSEDFMGVRLIATSSTTATLVISTGTGGFWGGQANARNEFCIVNVSTDATQTTVYISTFSTVDEATYGWPIRGTEKECHDWTGFPLYLWHKNAEPAVTIPVLLAK